MSVELSRQRVRNIINEVGQAGLHDQFPDDFELYLMAFELVNSRDELVQDFVFPVLPQSININKISNSKVTKTASAVHVVSNSTFVPFDISVSGFFGRKLRLLLSNRNNRQENKLFSVRNFTNSVFDPRIKTGYGMCKIIESILESVRSADEFGNPHRLYFYNLAFNSNYIVEPVSFNFSQSITNNTIWQYNLTFTALAPIEQVDSNFKKSVRNLFKGNFLSDIGNTTVDALKDLI